MRPGDRRPAGLPRDGDERRQRAEAQAAESPAQPAARAAAMTRHPDGAPYPFPDASVRARWPLLAALAVRSPRADAAARRAAAPRREPRRPTSTRRRRRSRGSTAAGRGTVNQRDFREQWMPLRGDMMLGVGSTVFQGKTQSYEYLRIEPRADGVYYVALPSGQQETAFKLDVDHDGRQRHASSRSPIPQHEFPQRIIYRRGDRGLAVRDDRRQDQGRGPQGHLPDAPRRLRDRRVHPQVDDGQRLAVAGARQFRADARRGPRRRAAALLARQRVPEGRASPAARPSHLRARRRARPRLHRGVEAARPCAGGQRAAGRTRSPRIATASRSRSARATSRPARR